MDLFSVIKIILQRFLKLCGIANIFVWLCSSRTLGPKRNATTHSVSRSQVSYPSSSPPLQLSCQRHLQISWHQKITRLSNSPLPPLLQSCTQLRHPKIWASLHSHIHRPQFPPWPSHSQTLSISGQNPGRAGSQTRSPHLHTNLICYPSLNPILTQVRICTSTWVEWSSAFCIHEPDRNHRNWSRNAYLHWRGCKEQTDDCEKERLVIDGAEMCPAVVFHSRTMLLNFTSSNAGWNHCTRHHPTTTARLVWRWFQCLLDILSLRTQTIRRILSDPLLSAMVVGIDYSTIELAYSYLLVTKIN
jgi:hypothetical protein